MRQILTSPQLQVTIDPAGAEICSVTNKEGLEFIWPAKKEVWPRHAPVLFPVVGRLKENRFYHDGVLYPLGQHGFARDMKFLLSDHHEQGCTFRLSSGELTRNLYPFEFILEIRYELQGNTLNTHYTVSNPASTPLFFSIGAHPGFRCPLLPHERFEDYALWFETSTLEARVLNQGLRAPQTRRIDLPLSHLPLSKELFKADALVFENAQVQRVSLRSGTSAHRIDMECQGWPYFGVWTRQGCDEFICLEPWYGIADAENSSGELSQKEGILRLEAGQQFSCRFSIRFS